MEDKIYYKTRCDGLWEECPHKAFGIYTLIYLSIVLGSMVLPIPDILTTIGLIVITVYLIAKSFLLNQSRNMSKSTAFVERNGILYAIQLLYAYNVPGNENNPLLTQEPNYRKLYDGNSHNDSEVAANVQAHESEVRNRRQDIKSFSKGLDDILRYLEVEFNKYHVLPDARRSKLIWMFKYNIENAGMTYVRTYNASYNFLIIHNPQIIEETKQYFKIRFLNEDNEVCTSKFTNCYDGLIEDIKYNSSFYR